MYKEQKTSGLDVLLNQIKKIESMKISKDKFSKWSTDNNSLFNTIDKIFESGLSKLDKQIVLEKAIFEYDTNFFIDNLHIVSNEIKIFSQEYNNISTNYTNL